MIMRLFLVPAFVASLAVPVAAGEIPLSAISAYLNGIKTAETSFTQINPDGSGASGKVYIQRPGRMRFEYAEPDKTVVLASGGEVAIFDSRSNQPPEQYPLKKTPLNLILGAHVDLDQARMVVAHDQEGALTVVIAQDPDHPEYGNIALGFADNPVALRQWIVTDQSGAQTTVLLDRLVAGGDYAPSLFQIEAEMERRAKN